MRGEQDQEDQAEQQGGLGPGSMGARARGQAGNIF